MMLLRNQQHGPPQDLSSQALDASTFDPAYFFLPEFTQAGVGEEFMAVMPPARAKSARTSGTEPPSGLPTYLAHLWAAPVLDREQEYHCFRKLNYLKHLLEQAQRRVRQPSVEEELVEEIDALRESIERTRNFLVESNLRLVVSIAKRHAAPSSEQFEELICVGNVALIRAIDLFDFRRGTRLSTYAFQAIERSIYSLYRRDKRYRSRLAGDGSMNLHQVARDAGASDRVEREAAEAQTQVEQLMKTLDDRDRRIVKARLGIDRPGGAAAFHVIAQEIELSTTRTIQLFKRCLKQMRATATRAPSRHAEPNAAGTK